MISFRAGKPLRSPRIETGGPAGEFDENLVLDRLADQVIDELLRLFGMGAVLDDARGLGGDEGAVCGINDSDVLIAAGDVAMGGVFHGDAQGVLPGGYTLVNQTGAVEDLGVDDQLVDSLPAVELVDPVSLGVGRSRFFRVRHDDLTLPLGVEEVLPGLRDLLGLDEALVDHDDHHVGVARSPAGILLHVARRKGFRLGRLVGLEILLGIFQNGHVAAPENVAQRLVLLGGDPFHRLSRAQADDGNLDAGLRLETLRHQVEQLGRVGGVKDDLRRRSDAGERQKDDGKNRQIPDQLSVHEITPLKLNFIGLRQFRTPWLRWCGAIIY